MPMPRVPSRTTAIRWTPSATTALLSCVVLVLGGALFATRAWHGIWAISFLDEIMHLLGGRALNSGYRLYRTFVEMHGPGIFMLAQVYGALFGWAHANLARLIPAGLMTCAALTCATTPAFAGRAERFLSAGAFLGIVGAIWLTQSFYLFSYYPVSGAFAAITLAWFVVPAWTGQPIPRWMAAAAGVSSAMLGFQAYSEAPTAFLFSAGACIVAWRTGRGAAARSHLAGILAASVVQFAWLVIWGDVVGYLAFHIAFSQTAYRQFVGMSWIGFLSSLVLSSRPDRLVQDVGIVCGGAAAAICLVQAARLGRAWPEAVLSVALAGAGVLLLEIRAMPQFQNGAFVITAAACFALALPMLAAPLRRYAGEIGASGLAVVAALLIGAAELAARHALSSPTPMTFAQIAAEPRSLIAQRVDNPYFDEIRTLVHPNERMLALVYRPDLYWGADRLPMDGFYDYLPADAVYAASPWFGKTRDLCKSIVADPPPVVIFDDWEVWDRYKPEDYMPCVLRALRTIYRPVPQFSDKQSPLPPIYVRADRAALLTPRAEVARR